MDRLFLATRKVEIKKTIEEFEKKRNELKLKQDFAGDIVDRVNLEKEESNLIYLNKRSIQFIEKLKRALKKIENGHYGECDECGESISSERLEARPSAELCLTCKEEKEFVENHSWITKDNVFSFPTGERKLKVIH